MGINGYELHTNGLMIYCYQSLFMADFTYMHILWMVHQFIGGSHRYLSQFPYLVQDFATIPQYSLGITIIQFNRGIPINEPIQWNYGGALNTAKISYENIIAIEHGPVEIVSFPINSMVDLSVAMLFTLTRGYPNCIHINPY